MPHASADDLTLLERATHGDESAFRVLYERHAQAIYRFACRLVGDTAAAEDVTHDCFLSLIKQPGNFDPARGALRTYLYGAARNLGLKHLRRRGVEIAVDELVDEPRADSATDAPLARLLDEEISLAIRRALDALPPLQREVIVLFEFEELSLAEIAQVVGAEIGAVKARLARARQRLRVLLAPYGAAASVVAEEHEHA